MTSPTSSSKHRCFASRRTSQLECAEARNVSQSARSLACSSVGVPFCIRELAQHPGELAREGIEVLHRRQRQPDELLDVLDASRRAVREAPGEPRRLDLKLHEPL